MRKDGIFNGNAPLIINKGETQSQISYFVIDEVAKKLEQKLLVLPYLYHHNSKDILKTQFQLLLITKTELQNCILTF